MIRRSRGCFGILVSGLLLLLAAWAGWRWGGAVFPTLESWLGLEGPTAREVRPSPELGRRTVERVDSLLRAPDPGEIVLSEAEVASVVHYVVPGLVPEGLELPDLDLRGGGVRLTTRASLAALPPLPELEAALGVLPDTLPVRIDASLMPFGDRDAVLVVHAIRVAAIPLPRRMIPGVLAALGRTARPGLPPDAIPVPLPPELHTAYVVADSLVLVASR